MLLSHANDSTLPDADQECGPISYSLASQAGVSLVQPSTPTGYPEAKIDLAQLGEASSIKLSLTAWFTNFPDVMYDYDLGKTTS